MGIKIASDKQANKIIGNRSYGRYAALKIKYENLIKEHVDLEEKFHTVLVDNYHLAEYVQELEKQHEDSVCYERELVHEWNEQQRMIEELKAENEQLKKDVHYLGEIVFNHVDGPNREGFNPYQE